MRNTVKKVSIAVSSVIASLFILEWILRLLPGSSDARYNSIYTFNEGAGGYYDLLPGRNVVVNGVTHRINSKGIRDEEYPGIQGENIYRIVGLGDSVTFAAGVPLEDTFIKQMCKHLNSQSQKARYECLNFGLSGINIHPEVHRLKILSRYYDADHVILQMLLCDFLYEPQGSLNRGLKAVVKKFSKRYLWATYFLAKRAIQTHRLREEIPESENLIAYTTRIYRERKEDLKQAEKKLLELKSLCENMGAHLTVVIFPYYFTVSGKYPFHRYHAMWKIFFKENNIACIDLMDFIPEEKLQSLSIKEDDTAHPGIEGHHLFGEILAKQFMERNRGN